MKTATLSVRVDAKLLEKLVKMERETLIERASLVRAALEALTDHFEAAGSISFPLRITSGGRSKAGEGK